MLRTIVNIECREENIVDFIHFSFLNYIFAKSHDGDFVFPYIPQDCGIYKILNKTILSSDKILKSISDEVLENHKKYLLRKEKAFEDEKGIFVIYSDKSIFNDFFIKDCQSEIKDKEKIYIFKDGKYSQEFINVLTEHYNYVTHKIRPEEEFYNSCVESDLFRKFGWESTGYAHVESLKTNIDKEKILDFYKSLDSLQKIYRYILNSSIREDSKHKYINDLNLFENSFELKDMKSKDINLNI